MASLSTPSYAHEMYRNETTFITYDSTVDFTLGNAYDKAAFFDLQLFTKDMVEVPYLEWYVEDQYLEQIEEVYLKPTDSLTLTVHVKDAGKYYFCSTLKDYEDETAQTNVRSRICSRIQRI